MQTIDELRQALNYTAAPAQPDPAAIISRGRRQRALRRLVTSAAATVTVAAVALAAVNLGPARVDTGPGPGPARVDTGPDQGDGPPRLAGAAPNAVLVASVGAAAPDEAPAQFDPLRRTLHVGWIPAGLPREMATVAPFEQGYAASDANDLGVVVTILARGRAVTDLPSGQRGMPADASSVVSTPTEPINGRPAECLSGPGQPDSCTTVRWQYAPDAWALVSYAYSNRTVEEANRATRQVAESVALTGGDPVRLPFTLAGPVTSGMKIASSLVSTGGGRLGFWYGEVALVDTDEQYLARRYVGPEIHIEANRVDPAADPGHTALQVPNSTVDGHPAWRQEDGRAVVVFPEPDLRVMFEYFERPGDATTAVTEVHLTPTPDAPATWLPPR